MSETKWAVMPYDDYKNACNSIRAKSGKTDLIKSGDLSAEIDSLPGPDYTIEDGLLDGSLSGDYTNNRITSIADSKLSGTKLTSFSSNSVITIGGSAFNGCTTLKEVNLPNAVTMKSHAFYGCSALENANLPLVEGIRWGTNYFDGCKSLKEIRLPKIYDLNTYGFANCPLLEKVDVGNENGGSILFGVYCFHGSTAVNTLIVRSPVITNLAGGLLNNTPIGKGTGYIYVPKALLSDDDATKDYRRATNWVTYANQFRAIEDYPEICGGAE